MSDKQIKVLSDWPKEERSVTTCSTTFSLKLKLEDEILNLRTD